MAVCLPTFVHWYQNHVFQVYGVEGAHRDDIIHSIFKAGSFQNLPDKQFGYLFTARGVLDLREELGRRNWPLPEKVLPPLLLPNGKPFALAVVQTITPCELLSHET